jgi:cytochrome c-type biogenesis protein
MIVHPDAIVSFTAGILSFLSPCVLPLIPSYLSFIGGTSVRDLSGPEPARGRVVSRTAFFCLGFTLVFVVLGIVFSASAFALNGLSRRLTMAAGIVVVLFGLNVIFDFWKTLNIERRFHLKKRPTGFGGSFLAGVAFSVGWSPCVGPILASILLLAGRRGEIGAAIGNLGLYSLGLALPFLGMAIFFSRLAPLFVWLKSRLDTIRILSGVFLVLIGTAMALGRFEALNSLILRAGYGLSGAVAGNRKGFEIGFAIFYGTMAGAILAIPRARKRPIGRLGFALIACFAALAILESSGLISTAQAIGLWLTYQGV